MKAPTQRKLALAVGVPSALVAAGVIGFLVKDYFDARRDAPLDTQRIEDLQKQAQEDTTQAQALVDELDRQTEVSLARDARHAVETKALLVAAVLFLVSAKWFASLSSPSPPHLDAILTQHDEIARQSRKTADGRPILRGRSRRVGDDTPARASADQVPTLDKQPSRMGHPADDGDEALDLSVVDAIVARAGREREAAISIIQAIQAHYRYLPDEALKRVCELTEIPPAQIAGVSTFYSQFRRSPVGKHLMKVCHGTACHVAGARTITDEIRRHLAIAPDADTDSQRVFTVEEVACVGCCSLAPVIMLDDVSVGRLTPSIACEAVERHRERGGA